MGGLHLQTILRRLSNGQLDELKRTPPQPETPPKRARNGLSQEQLLENMKKAQAAKEEGMLVWMSKDTLTAFAALLGTPPTRSIMRGLLEQVASGKVKLSLVETQKPSPQVRFEGLKQVPIISSAPYTLKQAAVVLGVDADRLYYRCAMRRIAFFRDGGRYFIPAEEVRRLQTVGIQ